MSRRSNVFSLPPQVFEIIAKDLEIDDLFTLSTCSERSFNLVKNSMHLFDTLKIQHPFVLTVFFDSMAYCELRDEQSSEIITWWFKGKRDPKRYELEDDPQCSVKMDCGQFNEKTIVFRKNLIFLDDYAITVENSIQTLIQFVEHISTLFNAPVEKLFIAPEATVHLEAIQSIPILKKCNRVAMHWETIGTISHEAMRLAVEGFDCEEVELDCSFDRNFTLPLKQSCKYLHLFNSEVSNQQLNIFLHQWIQSSSKPVNMMIVAAEFAKDGEKYGIYGDKCWREPETAAGRENSWDLREIAQGLSSYVINYSKDQERLVFQRETDGMQLKLEICCLWRKTVRLTALGTN